MVVGSTKNGETEEDDESDMDSVDLPPPPPTSAQAMSALKTSHLCFKGFLERDNLIVLKRNRDAKVKTFNIL